MRAALGHLEQFVDTPKYLPLILAGITLNLQLKLGKTAFLTVLDMECQQNTDHLSISLVLRVLSSELCSFLHIDLCIYFVRFVPKYFYFYYELLSYFVKCFFCISGYDHVIFLIYPVDIMENINWFSKF